MPPLRLTEASGALGRLRAFFAGLFGGPSGARRKAQALCAHFIAAPAPSLQVEGVFAGLLEMERRKQLPKLEWKFCQKLLQSLRGLFRPGQTPPWFSSLAKLNRKARWDLKPKFASFLRQVFKTRALGQAFSKRVSEVLKAQSEASRRRLKALRRATVAAVASAEVRRDFQKAAAQSTDDPLAAGYKGLVGDFNALISRELAKVHRRENEIREFFARNLDLFVERVAQTIAQIVSRSRLNAKLLFVDREGRLDFEVVYKALVALDRVSVDTRSGTIFTLDLLDLAPPKAKTLLI